MSLSNNTGEVEAEVAERACLAEALADVTVDGEGLLLVPGGLLVAAQ
jgi:hypothetical protein